MALEAAKKQLKMGMIRIDLISAASGTQDWSVQDTVVSYTLWLQASLNGQPCWRLCQEEGLGCPRLIPQTGPASVNFREGYVAKNGTRNKVSVGGGISGTCANAWSGRNGERKELVGERSMIFKACAFVGLSPKADCPCVLC